MFLVLLFTLLVSSGAAAEPDATAGATTRVAGRVLDTEGSPVPGAIVTLRVLATGAVQRAATDDDGGFAFVEIPAGRYLIDASLDGLRQTLARELRVEGVPLSAVDLRLDHAAREEQVVVTAADRPQRIEEVGKAISVLTRADIETRQESSVPELLRTIPGLQVLNNGGYGQLSQIRLRGLRADASAILVDGLRFRDAASTQGDATDLLSSLNVVDLDRIEVLRGSASSLYGTNATGGAVNIVSRIGAAPTAGSLQLEAGQLGLARGRATIGGAAGSRVRYSAGLLRLVMTDGVDGNDSADSLDGQGSVAVQLAPGTAITGRVWSARNRADLNASPSTDGIPAANLPAAGVIEARALPHEQVERLRAGAEVDYGDATYVPSLDNPDYGRRASMFTGALVLTHQASERVSVRATYQRVRTARTFEDGPRGPGFQPLGDNFSRYTGTIDTADVRASVELRRDLLVTAGYEFERERYFDRQDNREPAPAHVDVETRIRQRAHAVFGQASWQALEDRLHVTGAVRAQSFGLSRPSFRFSGTAQNYDRVPIDAPPSAVTGDAAVSYALVRSGTRLRLHAGNAYRAPALYERFGAGFSANPSTGQVDFSPFGDPLLEPDRYVSVDAGIDQSLLRDRVRLHATWFHTDIDQLTAFDFSGGIDPSTDPYGRFVGYLNGDGGRTRGLEIGAQARPSSALAIAGSYTFADSVTDRDVAVPGIFRLMGIARHTFSVSATRQVSDRLIVHGVLNGTGERYGSIFAGTGSRAFAYPAFATLDLGAAYTLPLAGDRSLRLSAKVNNLFDRDYYDLGWRAPGARFLGGVTFSFRGGL